MAPRDPVMNKDQITWSKFVGNEMKFDIKLNDLLRKIIISSAAAEEKQEE